jgi:hypothetical protein
MLSLRSRLLFIAAVVLTLGVMAPLRAADIDKFLPTDTEVFVRINIRQALDSPLAKKLGIDQAKELLKQVDGLDDALKELDFDLFRDLDTFTFAAPDSTESDRLLAILHGKFKVAKFKTKGEALAKDMADVIKLHKVNDGAGGQVNVYQVTAPGQDMPLFVAIVNETTILVSPGKDYVADAIKRDKLKEAAALKNKDFQALLEKMDPKQTVSLAAIGPALTRMMDDGIVKEALQKIDAIGGGVTLGDDIKIELVVGAKTVQEAKDLHKTVNDGITQGLAVVALLAVQNQDLAPVVDVLKTIKCTVKDKNVTLKADISADVLNSLGKALGGK